MSRDAAILALEMSLKGDSSTPNLGSGDRVSYLQEQRALLRACFVEPIAVKARASAWAQKYCGLRIEPYQMVLVAYHSDGAGHCLLYNPETSLFSLAYGHPDNSKGLELIGYSSPDALAEWLG